MARFEAHRRQLIAQRRVRTVLLVAGFLVAIVVSANVAQLLPDKLAAGLPKVGGYIQAITPNLKWPVLFAGTKTEGSLAYWYFNLPKYLLLLLETISNIGAVRDVPRHDRCHAALLPGQPQPGAQHLGV